MLLSEVGFLPFESLFSKITDGLTVEKKNKDELFIDYENSPKFLITTNYNIDNESQASNRRQFLLVVSLLSYVPLN